MDCKHGNYKKSLIAILLCFVILIIKLNVGFCRYHNPNNWIDCGSKTSAFEEVLQVASGLNGYTIEATKDGKFYSAKIYRGGKEVGIVQFGNACPPPDEICTIEVRYEFKKKDGSDGEKIAYISYHPENINEGEPAHFHKGSSFDYNTGKIHYHWDENFNP